MARQNQRKRIETEKELRQRERDDEIMPRRAKYKRHPHEMFAPVGSMYIPEELDEQGFTEEGLGTPDNEDDPNANPIRSRKIA